MQRSFVFYALFCGAIFVFLGSSRALAVRSRGIDVSNHNGSINWTTVHNSGIDFAWAKATEGTSFTDSYFNGVNGHNMNNGTAAGVLMGAYHFARPDLNSDATAEAAHFVSVASPYLTDGYLRPVLDVETGFGLTTTALSNWINTFCSYVTSHAGADADPLIYMSSSPAGSEVNSSVTTHPLWVANYPSNAEDPPAPTGNPPAGTGVWSDWTFWQYSSKGTSATVPGISSTYVDLDVAHGDINFVQQFVIGGTVLPTSFERFDANGTASGSGVASNGSYTWEAAGFSSSAAGTDPVSWNDGNFLRLAAGTDAGSKNYTITANSDHTFAGMY
ncbi:MAG TPA: glycoside hydrolase family 25 protein, partial [Lacipirellulaceae bacterium]|nr:glycoside hydrolase family 25 protein [Lacipirellulaceae bacterium]